MNGRSTMRIARLALPVVLTALALGACSGFGSSGKPAPPPDPNAFPTNYRNQVLALVNETLKDRADFRNTLISQPAVKPIGDNQHYVVCVRLAARTPPLDKMVIFYAGAPNQFIDATPEACGGAVYEPFKELEALTPSH